MKALDIVRTESGSIGFIVETTNNGSKASINFIGNMRYDADRNAWYETGELTVIDSIPHLLAIAMCHPFGSGHKDADMYFNTEKI